MSRRDSFLSGEANAEKALIEGIRRGELLAFEEMVLRYQDRIFTLVRRLLGGRSEAADVTQEVFLRAWQRFHSFQGRSRLYTWLYRIAVNLSLSFLERESRCPVDSLEGSQGIWELPAIEPLDPAVLHDSVEIGKAVEQALAHLPKEQRIAFVLREIYGFSYEEIGELTYAKQDLVRARVCRARRRLQQLLLSNFQE